MRVRGVAKVLEKEEIDLIEKNAFRILEEIGVVVEEERIRQVLADHGATVDEEHQRVKFSRRFLENFLAGSDKSEIKREPILCDAGSYPLRYLVPETNNVINHTRETITNMIRLADYLENIDTISGIGNPSFDVSPVVGPLWMRFLCWKYAQKKPGHCSEIWDPRLSLYALEMGKIMADAKGEPLSKYADATFELVSPLQFKKPEGEIFYYFWEHHLPVHIGSILTSGGTAPTTLAGALALHLAEKLFINILQRIFYGRKRLRLNCTVTVLDMKIGMFPFGRPELALMHLAVGQLARHYHAIFWANSFLCDAKFPSSEAGMQKAMTAIPAILAGSISLGVVGVLSIDEYSSPVQLVIDNEFAGALKRFAKGFEIDEEKIAYDLIKEVGPGGLFTGTSHTVNNYRKEHWQPKIFSREMYNSWLQGDQKIDQERALDICNQVLAEYHPSNLDETTEKKLLSVIEQAEKDLSR